MTQRRHPRSPAARHARGLSLVEILVAAAIGLIASVAIFQVFASFEGQKRTTAAGGEAQTNGALALFTIERELRMAGYGINSLAFLGCNVNGWDRLQGGGTQFTLQLVPVVITQGTAGAPDTISIMYGSGDLLPNPVTITHHPAAASVVYMVQNRFGFRQGDLVVAAQPGADCTLREVTTLPGTPGQTANVIHNPGHYTNPDTGAQVQARYNRPGGLPPPNNIRYDPGASLFNLGALPANNIYSVQNSQLVLQRLLSAPDPAPAAIYDGIVQLQAQYGKDDGTNNGTVVRATFTPNDGIIDRFDEAQPLNAAEWAQVLAVRLAVVARSNLPERPDPDGVCRTTTAAPTWAGGTINLAADPNWQCYRYKVFETTVPLRNMIWRPQ